MNYEELKQDIEKAPLSSRAVLNKMLMFASTGNAILPEFQEYLDRSSNYHDFFSEILADETQKKSMLWAECAKLNRRNWLNYFEPKMLIQQLRMKTDGLPIQMGTGVVLAPTGSRDNIANLYVFESNGFNQKAAEFVTSIGGTFKIADYEFCGIYGIYKYRGSVILEEWEVEKEPEYKPEK